MQKPTRVALNPTRAALTLKFKRSEREKIQCCM
jgi:hypothetical protein